MKTTLIDYTGYGTPNPANHAASVLLFTKSTRLTMSPGLLEGIKAIPKMEKEVELGYMANTIPSSWEFVHYTFMIEGVTRGFTHQFVRSRTCSFAQQTMRVLNVEGWEYGTGPTISTTPSFKKTYSKAMNNIAEAYIELLTQGAAIEDARGILPTNILTNICMSCNLRTFVELVHKRSSPRVQGEYREVLEAMKEAVIAVHPWVSLFVERTFDKAAKDLDEEIDTLFINEKIDSGIKIKLMKLVDQLRQKQ